MKRPLCSNTEAGACPCWALAGTRFCLRHTEPARQGFGDPIDIGYRPGGFATSPPVARARVDLGPATAELPVAAPPGWLARTLRRATS